MAERSKRAFSKSGNLLAEGQFVLSSSPAWLPNCGGRTGGAALGLPVDNPHALVAGHELVGFACGAVDVERNLEMAAAAFPLVDGHDDGQAGLGREPVVEKMWPIASCPTKL